MDETALQPPLSRPEDFQTEDLQNLHASKRHPSPLLLIGLILISLVVGCLAVWQIITHQSSTQITQVEPAISQSKSAPTPSLSADLGLEAEELGLILNSEYSLRIEVADDVSLVIIQRFGTGELLELPIVLPDGVETLPTMYPRQAISAVIADRYLLAGFAQGFAIVVDLEDQTIQSIEKLTDFAAMFGKLVVHPSQPLALHTVRYEGPESVTDAWVLTNGVLEHTDLTDTSALTQYNRVFGIETVAVAPEEFILTFSTIDKALENLPKTEEEYMFASGDAEIHRNEVEAEEAMSQTGKYQQVVCNLDPGMIGQGDTYGCYGLVSTEEVSLSVDQPVLLPTPEM